MKFNKDSPIIKHKVNARYWKFAQENATKVAICVDHELDKDGNLLYDIIAELEYEEYLEIKGNLRKIFGSKKFWTMGGWELGFLYPLLIYTDKKKLTESSSLFYIDTKIDMKGINTHFSFLLDTGAGMCHMTYPLWEDMKQHMRFFDENKKLCELAGIKFANDLTFENIPIYKKKGTTLGDGSTVLVFQTKIDAITFQKNKLGRGLPVTLNNITVNVMDHFESHFIIGCNVIKYLKLHSEPIGDEFTISIDFTDNGKRLLEKDRTEKKNNYMTHFYNFEDLIKENVCSDSSVTVQSNNDSYDLM